MLNIGNKTYRNLQEQVGYNTKCIKEIDEFLDGLNVQDSVVDVPDISHIMTDDELKIVKQALAFIVYNGSLYIKKSMDSVEAKFDIVFTISGGTAISFSTSEITVTLANGALGITNTTYSTYSVTQLDTKFSAKADLTYVDGQLALKADLAGAAFSGPITAPSIVEDMEGYSFTKSSSNADKDFEYVYASPCKNGNKITFVIAVNLTVHNSINNTVIGKFTIPATIGARLFPATIGSLTTVLTIGNVPMSSNGTTGVSKPFTCFKISNTEISFSLYGINDLSLETKYYCRIEATFLLSDNLAV